jgi:hypothetical protein
MTTWGHTNDVAHQRHASAVRPSTVPYNYLTSPSDAAALARSSFSAWSSDSTAVRSDSLLHSTGPHAYVVIPQLGAFPLTELRIVEKTT